MDKIAEKALRKINKCIAEDRLRLTLHFRARLTQRGLLWPDVLSVLDNPYSIRADGLDDCNRSRWIITGRAATDDLMTIVCALGKNEQGDLTVFITTYWGS